jgi:hypothetical protein
VQTITDQAAHLSRQKVRDRFLANPLQSETLEQLVTNENSNKVGSATEGLMWLLRSLAFTCKSLQHAQANPSEELKDAFTKGYDVSLGPIHRSGGFFSVQGALMKAAGLMFNVRHSFLTECHGLIRTWYIDVDRYRILSSSQEFLREARSQSRRRADLAGGA